MPLPAAPSANFGSLAILTRWTPRPPIGRNPRPAHVAATTRTPSSTTGETAEAAESSPESAEARGKRVGFALPLFLDLCFFGKVHLSGKQQVQAFFNEQKPSFGIVWQAASRTNERKSTGNEWKSAGSESGNWRTPARAVFPIERSRSI